MFSKNKNDDRPVLFWDSQTNHWTIWVKSFLDSAVANHISKEPEQDGGGGVLKTISCEEQLKETGRLSLENDYQ